MDIEAGGGAFALAVFAVGGGIQGADGRFEVHDAGVSVPGDGFEDIPAGIGVIAIGEAGLLAALHFDDPFDGGLGGVVGIIIRICVIVIRVCCGLASDADIEQLEGEDAYQCLS
jgi:hypothetical protein